MIVNSRTLNKIISRSENLQRTLLDLTEDTVNETNLSRGETAHDKEGDGVVGRFQIDDAEAWAIGTRNGVLVGEDDITYHNNSKYYSQMSKATAAVSGSAMMVAGSYADAAELSALASADFARMSENYEIISGSYMNIAGSYMNIAGERAKDSEAFAMGKRGGALVPPSDPTYHNNSKYYYEQSKSIAESLVGVLRPKGTCLFAELPLIADSQSGDLWNIEDEFTTTSDFREGAGCIVAAGSDVYLTVDLKWDVLAGTTSDYIGCTSSAVAIHGLVPAAQAGEQDKVFQGDGSWGHKLQIDIVELNGVYGYIDSGGNFVDFKSQADIDAAVAAARVGTATAADVKAGVTFTNSTASGLTGTFAAQEKTVTAGTSAASVTPDSGKYLSKVTYNPTPSQTKSASPSTSAQTISPDSGKLLSSVSISAISPQRAAGTSVTLSGIDSHGPYVYFPYGWYPQNHATYGCYVYMTAAQAQALHKHTATYEPTANSSASDMGEKHNYRYVDTRTVYTLGYIAAPVNIVFLGAHPMIGVSSYANWFTTNRAYKYILICSVAMNDTANLYIDITTDNSTLNSKVVSSYNTTITGGNYNWKVLTKALYYPDVPANVKFQCKGNYGASAVAYGVYKG